MSGEEVLEDSLRKSIAWLGEGKWSGCFQTDSLTAQGHTASQGRWRFQAHMSPGGKNTETSEEGNCYKRKGMDRRTCIKGKKKTNESKE